MSIQKCDTCSRRKLCNEEGRLITYYTLDDMFMDPEYEKDGNKAAHGMLKIDEVCPLKEVVSCVGSSPTDTGMDS